MRPSVINAFMRPEAAMTNRSDAAVPTDDRIAGLAMMTATLESCGFGAILKLTPMQAVDAAWLLLQNESTSGLTVIMNVAQSVWTENGVPLSIAEIILRLGIDTQGIYDDDAVLVDSEALMQILSLIETESLLAISVDEPIEHRDVEAIRKAIAVGLSPLDVELNASAALFVNRDRDVEAHVRRKELALGLIGQNLRLYLAATTGKLPDRFVPPPSWQLERVLGVSGRIAVRPVETSIMAGTIDIGINTERDDAFGPAKMSLIYDRPSRTWHDER